MVDGLVSCGELQFVSPYLPNDCLNSAKWCVDSRHVQDSRDMFGTVFAVDPGVAEMRIGVINQSEGLDFVLPEAHVVDEVVDVFATQVHGLDAVALTNRRR